MTPGLWDLIIKYETGSREMLDMTPGTLSLVEKSTMEEKEHLDCQEFIIVSQYWESCNQLHSKVLRSRFMFHICQAHHVMFTSVCLH